MKAKFFSTMKPWSGILATFFLSCLSYTCSSTKDDYQYDEYDNFSVENANLEEQENGSAQEDNEYGNDIANYESSSETESNAFSNYENIIADGNLSGENINNAASDEFDSDFTNSANLSLSENSAQQNSNSFSSLGVANNLVQPVTEIANAPVASEGAIANGEYSYEYDIQPSMAKLWWVGYNYQKKDKKVFIEIMTRGEPQYEIFQERNQGMQPELVLRLFSTAIRSKLRRDIDASEFRSPVAYVRMREDPIEGHTDVVLTLREATKPSFFAKDGNFLLTYEISDKYFSPEYKKQNEGVAVAELKGDEDIKPVYVAGTDLPKSVARPSNIVPIDASQANVLEEIPVMESQSRATIPSIQEMPASFGPNIARANNTSNEQNIVSTVIPDPKVSAPQEPGMMQNNAAIDMPQSKASALKQPSRPASLARPGTQEYMPQVYQAPYSQPYQQRYQQPSYVQPQQYPQPYYQQPIYPQQQVAPYPQPSPVPGVAPSPSPEPLNIEDEVEGSGFNMDDSIRDFDFEGDEDAIEKFEVRTTPSDSFEILNEWHGSAVAQYDDFSTVDADFGFDNSLESNLMNDTLPSGTNYSGGEYDYEASPVAEVTELSGSTDEQPMQNYTGKIIDLEFYRADITSVLKVFTEQTGINFVYPAQIASLPISVKLKNVPWDAALKAILDSNNLAMTRVTDTIIKIDFNANIATHLTQQNALARQQALAMATKTIVFRLSYARARSLVEPLQAILKDPNDILPPANVTSDERTNSVIVEGIPQILSKAKAIIQRMDTPTLQAEIAARIVEVSKTAQNFLGVRWGGGLAYDAGRGLGFGSLNFPNSITSRYAIDATKQTGAAGSFDFRFGSINELIDLDLRLQMEEQLNNSETLQSQKIIVQDGGNAMILSGKTDRFRPLGFVGAQGVGGIAGGGAMGGGAAAAAGAAGAAGAGMDGGAMMGGGLEAVEVNVTLAIENLQISNDNMVTLPLKIESNSQAPLGAGSVSSTFERKIETTLVSRSGETVVIGGAYAASKSTGHVGIPFLSSIPIIGALFRQKSKVEESKELLVMLTPNIISPERSGSATIDSVAPATSSKASFDSSNNPLSNYEPNSPSNGGENYGNYNAVDSENANSKVGNFGTSGYGNNYENGNNALNNNNNAANANQYNNSNNQNSDNSNNSSDYENY